MRMHGKFVRYLGAAPTGGKTLGNDTLPAAGVRPTGDNVIGIPMRSQSGFPLKNLYLGAVYTGAGAPTTIGPLNVYAWDEATQFLVLVGTSATVTVGVAATPVAPTVMTPITLLDSAPTFANAQAGGNSNSASLLVIMGPGTTQPNGTYQIYVGGGM